MGGFDSGMKIGAASKFAGIRVPEFYFARSSKMRILVLVFTLTFTFPLLAQEHPMLPPADRIDQLAQTARSNTDADIKALADAAIHPFGVPGPVAEQFRVSVVAAEQRYRQGKGQGVTEEELVAFHNRVTKALKLPEFAEVDHRQMREFRMTLVDLSPNLMTPKRDKDPAAGHEISHEMSPLQAAHLETMMIFQKYMSPMYQLHPKDWTPEIADKIQHEGHHLDPKQHRVRPEDDKSTQFMNSFMKGVTDLSVAQGIEIANDARRTFKF
jgi:hypothetical protein